MQKLNLSSSDMKDLASGFKSMGVNLSEDIMDCKGAMFVQLGMKKSCVGERFVLHVSCNLFFRARYLCRFRLLSVLAKCKRSLDIDISHNLSVLHARAWTHGPACASPNTETQVLGIHHLIPGQRILIDHSANKIEFKLETQKIRDVFPKTKRPYQECLEQYLRNTYRTLFALSKRQDTEIELALSGGLDSRVNVGINAQTQA